jgi:hypothetical protein
MLLTILAKILFFWALFSILPLVFFGAGEYFYEKYPNSKFASWWAKHICGPL